jgi:hypothetical protein
MKKAIIPEIKEQRVVLKKQKEMISVSGLWLRLARDSGEGNG